MNSESSENKRHRYTRPPIEKRKGLSLSRSKTYQRILFHTHHLKFVTAPILAAMIYSDRQLDILPPAGKKYGDKSKAPSEGKNIDTVQRQIRKLWQHGYLEKRVQIVKNYTHHDPESENPLYTPDIYILGKLGRQYLAKEVFGVPYSEIKSPALPDLAAAHRGHPQGDYARLLHSRLISEVIAGFYLLASLNKERYEIVWSCHDREFDYEYMKQGKKRRLIPDGIIILKNKESGRMANFFLEIDRNTETMTKFSHKLRSYGELLRDQETGIYDIFIPLYEKIASGLEPVDLDLKHGNNFRVLTLTTGEKHRDFLAKSTNAHFNDSGAVRKGFWFGLLDTFTFHKREISKSNPKQVLDFSKLETIFTPLFKVPGKEGPVQLLRK